MMTRMTRSLRSADRGARRIGHRARGRAAGRRAGAVHRRAGRRRPSRLSGELRELPRRRPGWPQRSAAAGRRRLHEHLAQPHDRAICSTTCQATMPPGRSDRSPPEQYASIVAYILQQNGVAAGATGVQRHARPSPSARWRRASPDRGPDRGTAGPVRALRGGTRRRTRRRSRRRRRSDGGWRARWRSARGAAARRHRGRRSEELRAGDRRDAAQPAGRATG